MLFRSEPPHVRDNLFTLESETADVFNAWGKYGISRLVFFSNDVIYRLELMLFIPTAPKSSQN